MILILRPLESSVIPPVIRACEGLGFEVIVVRSEGEVLPLLEEAKFLILPFVYPYQTDSFVREVKLKHPGTRIIALTTSPYISPNELSAHGIDSVVSYRANALEHIRELLSKSA